jgi:peptidoglycan/xylan/chitin deacetylase (PgdA/CDA1 family)
MNSTNCHSGDQFRLDDLYGLIADRHELASHTFHHVSSRRTSARAFVQEVLQGRAAMQSLSGLMVSNNFAYPFGAVTTVTKRAVGKTMLSCRSIYPGVNGPVVDLNLLRANPLYGDTERLGFVRRLLQLTKELRGWLIFYTHDVQNTHLPYGCTPALLESTVKLVLNSSMKILTVNDVLAAAVKANRAQINFCGSPDRPSVGAQGKL